MISAFGIEHDTSISKATNDGQKSNVKRNVAIGGGAALGAGAVGTGGYFGLKRFKSSQQKAMPTFKTPKGLATEPLDVERLKVEPLDMERLDVERLDTEKPSWEKKSWSKPGLKTKSIKGAKAVEQIARKASWVKGL